MEQRTKDRAVVRLIDNDGVEIFAFGQTQIENRATLCQTTSYKHTMTDDHGEHLL